MQMPLSQSSFLRFVSYGNYVDGKLMRRKKETLSENVMIATLGALSTGRTWEDLKNEGRRFIALRDSWRDDIDLIIRENIRLKLAGRSLGAVNSAPFTLIFHKGIEYYTAAPLTVLETRVLELIERMEAHLPEGDEIRALNVPLLKETLDGWRAATSALDAHRRKIGMAASDRVEAIEDFKRVIERTYGLLIADHGVEAAERFFPRIRASRANTPDDPSGGEDDDLDDDI